MNYLRGTDGDCHNEYYNMIYWYLLFVFYYLLYIFRAKPI